MTHFFVIIFHVLVLAIIFLVPITHPHTDKVLALDQWTWIEQTLGNSTADYLWVTGHYPVWSVCSHGPTYELVVLLKPLLEKYGVTGYASGHDHCLEYLDEGKGPVYVISGAYSCY
jgi:hypothetical protein